MKASNIKIALLLAMAFMLGGGTLVTMYATGEAVVENGDTMYMVSHTEYRYNEPGQIVVRLVDFQDNAIVVNNCTATILYPNKTIFLGPALMSNTTTISGDHYYEFTTPNGPEGVYEYQSTCVWNGGARSQSATNSFHLSSALGVIQQQISDLNGTVLSINSSLSSQLSAVNLSISSSITSFRQEVQANFSSVLSAIAAIPVVNYSSELYQINSTVAANNALLVYMNATQTAMQSTLNNVNATTTNTYAYLTGTLATNVNSILSTLGVINATVNRIETNTVNINSTVNTILANQQAEVIMNTYSG